MKKLQRAAALTAAAASIALLGTLLPAAAFATTTPVPPPNNSPTKLAQITVAPTGPNVTKLSFAAQSSSGSTVVDPRVMRINTGTLRATGTKIITPIGGTRGGLYDAFTSSVHLTSTNTNMSGTSQGVWEGSKPLNADRIALLDTIATTGIGISVSAGPVGTQFGWSSGVWTYSTSDANQYMQTHDYSGLQFVGSVLTITESSQVSAKFGTASYVQITR